MPPAIPPLTDEWRDHVVTALRVRYGVAADMIEYVAILPANRTIWRAVCTHGAATHLQPVSETDPYIDARNVHTMDVVDEWAIEGHEGSTTAVRWVSGQCVECGRVQWALLAPDPIDAAAV